MLSIGPEFVTEFPVDQEVKTEIWIETKQRE